MSILVTGSTGFLGRSLIPKLLAKGCDYSPRLKSGASRDWIPKHCSPNAKNSIACPGAVVKPSVSPALKSGVLDGGIYKIHALARDPDKARAILPNEVEVIKGDVTESGLGIENPTQFNAVYHLAGLLDLGKNKKDELYHINVGGMRNVIAFCEKNKIAHLFFCSTAYTEGKNDYEKSKEQAEILLRHSNIPKITIFKPSIFVADSQTLDANGAGGLYHFAIMAARAHHRVEVVRRWVEGNLRLPIIEPVLRVRGNPDGNLNLIPVDIVAKFIAETNDEGTYWVTNPSPPKLSDVIRWIGDGLLLQMITKQDFKPTPIEALFQKLIKPFSPYLWSDELPSNLTDNDCPTITKEFVRSSVQRFILS